MKLPNTSRLHALRMANDARGYEMADQRERFARIAGRHENGTAPRAVSAFNLFQTPPELALRLVALLGDIPPTSRILEPSAGLGRILDALPKCEVVAVEQSATCTSELFRQDRESVQILQRDFLTVDTDETGFFDFVAMNPPFKMRRDIQHINHALTFLRKGGKLAGLCLDTDHREKALRSIADHWEKIPAGAFKSEGTGVPTVLFRVTV